jgi:hypothetical protein
VAYPDAPEFQTSGAGGYSPDHFYTRSRNGPDSERRWVSLGRQVIPAEMFARIEDLIHTRKFPAYRSVGDFIRDAIVHHLYNRLSELKEPYWHQQRDVFAMLFEVERIEIEGQALADAYARWDRLIRDQHDDKKRKEYLERIREIIPEIDNEYWRRQFEFLLR